jgi:hypothetical protein
MTGMMEHYGSFLGQIIVIFLVFFRQCCSNSRSSSERCVHIKQLQFLHLAVLIPFSSTS